MTKWIFRLVSAVWLFAIYQNWTPPLDWEVAKQVEGAGEEMDGLADNVALIFCSGLVAGMERVLSDSGRS